MDPISDLEEIFSQEFDNQQHQENQEEIPDDPLRNQEEDEFLAMIDHINSAEYDNDVFHSDAKQNIDNILECAESMTI